jgi:predicted enzyme related to lactoylglutathione lyase
MITPLTLVTILVRHQDEDLQWFTQVLGLEKRQDAAFGKGGRWLAFAPSGQNDFGIVLQKPDPDVHGEERPREKNSQIATWVFRADDLDTTYEALKSKNVNFVSSPTALPWGRQAIFEDLYGNQYALMGK